MLCCNTMRKTSFMKWSNATLLRNSLADKDCNIMVATYPCTKYLPIADIHGVRTGDDCISLDTVPFDDPGFMLRMFLG